MATSRILKHREFQMATLVLLENLNSNSVLWYRGPDTSGPKGPFIVVSGISGFDFQYQVVSDIAFYGWTAWQYSNVSIRGPFSQTLLRNSDYFYSQKKKRQWGLFIKTRNRHPKHRGKKSDLLNLRVPHR